MKNFWHSQHDSRIKLSQEEILEISQKINYEFPLNATTTRPEIVILPVDPYHIYIYWNLGTNLNSYWNVREKSREANSKKESGIQLTLRIYTHPSLVTNSDKIKIWFDVPIFGQQTQQQVRLPSYETAYSVAIGKRYPDNKFVVFAYSDIINVPLGKTSPHQPGKVINESVKLAQTEQSGRQSASNGSQPNNIATEDTVNPEIGKGIEVSLTSQHEVSIASVPDSDTVKLFDETLIKKIAEQNLSEKENIIPAYYKDNALEKFELILKTTSGKGIS